MEIENEIKKEIYEYVAKFDLNKEEMAQIDTYVLELLNNLNYIITSQSKILNDKDKVDIFKNLIMESIGDVEIG
tara:strand:+ start:123 stop:344 length:222 start_codon:yes stop_codon:yes gene_type:complete